MAKDSLEARMDEWWRIQLLGELRAQLGEHAGDDRRPGEASGPVATRFETRKTGALLAYLAFHLDRAVSREVLAEQLWPEEDPDATRPRLRQALAALRRALEPPGTPAATVLIADRATVRLDPQAVTTDVAEFERALRAAAQTASPHEQMQILCHAVALYRGDLLPGCDEEWVLPERERLAEAYIGALGRLAGLQAAAGDLEGAIATARQAVRADPLREESHEELMRLYAAAGRVSEALRQYRELERLLREELDAAPSAATHTLVEQLRAGTSTPACAPPRSLAPPAPETPLPLALPSTRPPGREAQDTHEHSTQRPASSRRHWKRMKFFATLVLVLLLLVVLSLRQRMRDTRPENLSLPRHRIAVLPFVSREDEPFAEGITTELISSLGQIRRLRVISQTSVMQFRGTNKSIAQIGRELNAGTVVEGTVSRANEKLRITARLIDVRTLESLWSGSYDRVFSMGNKFAIQSEIARRIASASAVQLRPEETEQIEKTPTDRLDAYVAYQQGRDLWKRRTEDALRASIDHFEHAIRLDPDYAAAYAGLADAYSLLGYYEHEPPRLAYPKAEQYAREALKRDPDLAEAHTSLAWVKLVYEWDWPGAEREFLRAIDLNPSNETAHQWYSLYLMARKRTRESLQEIEEARALDPLSPIINKSVGQRYYHARRYNRAIAAYQEALTQDPTYSLTHYWLGLAYEQQALALRQKRLLDRAIAEFQRAIQCSRGRPDPAIIAGLGHAYALAGRTTEAQTKQDELRQVAQRRYVSPVALATLATSLGDTDRALNWLRQAVIQRSGDLLMLGVEPRFDPLRSEPRFAALLDEISLP
jgi:DNA-binding SARP family transcriptional activator/TolB-like protein